ncbi:hypothetical protein BGW41_001218 [Actinomortierella wolfii]|nr:hypothetical protein BGW41_001218 [Actinomortierella wolfii]
MDIIFIPEFAERVFAYLDYPSRACCVRVSRAWYNLFVPLLWHTFGMHLSDPVRFGMVTAPQGACSLRIDALPLYVTDLSSEDSNNSSGCSSSSSSSGRKETLPALTIANRLNYPKAHRPFLPRERVSMWARLLSVGGGFTPEEKMAIQKVLAKYGRHIRCLSVRTVEAFRIYEQYCTRLQAFHCQFSLAWKKQKLSLWFVGLNMSDMRQLQWDIAEFVLRQPKLDSLYLPHELSEKTGIAMGLLTARTFTNWKHFDVTLNDQAYRNIATLLPRVRSARFQLRYSVSLETPLKDAHEHLRELTIIVPPMSFSAEKLWNLMISFPNLQQLIVAQSNSPSKPIVELTMDNGSMLTICGEGFKYGEAMRLVSIVPRLLVFTYNSVTEDCYTTLATYQRSLVHLTVEKDLPVTGNMFQDYNTVPPPTIGLLLVTCPRLKSIVAHADVLHARHVLDQPIVVQNMDLLACTIVGMPGILLTEKDTYNSLMAKWPISDSRAQVLTTHERTVLEKIEIRQRFKKILDDRVRHVAPTSTEFFQ